MKQFFTLMFMMCAVAITSNAQSLTELKEKKAALEATQAEALAQVDALQGEIDVLDKEITISSGWQKGLLGSLGLGFGSTSNWATSPNPNSSNSSLGIGITAFANRINDKDFWRNKGIITLGWQSLDTDTDDTESDGFLDDRTTDLLNISSLYGRRLSDKIALSALGELNSSVFNFLDPGTVDIGVGFTYTPNDELVIVVHPLNWGAAFSSVDGVSTQSSLGAKIRADYNHTFAGGLGWSSTFTTFVPYAEKDPTLFHYTWLNNLNYTIAGGVGLNLAFGLRNAEFESVDLQTYYTAGLSYAISK